MRKSRKHYTSQEKVALLRKHLIEKVPVSDICREADLQPTVFYRWQQELFENGTAAFDRAKDPTAPLKNKIEAMKEKLARKDGVIAELLEEHVSLKKKTLGES